MDEFDRFAEVMAFTIASRMSSRLCSNGVEFATAAEAVSYLMNLYDALKAQCQNGKDDPQ